MSRLRCGEFGKPGNRLWRAAYFAYLKRVVPLFGKVFCGDADTYRHILASLLPYPAQAGVAAAMDRTRWTNLRVVNLLGGVISIHCGVKPT